jgi:hypothetical protein
VSELPSSRSEEARRWQHSLRNELNVVTIATATALRLIERGASSDLVKEQLVRAEAACQRCGELVRGWPDGG